MDLRMRWASVTPLPLLMWYDIKETGESTCKSQILGWSDGSMSKELAEQVWGPGFKSLEPIKICTPCVPMWMWGRDGRNPRSSQASLPDISSSKQQRRDLASDQYTRLFSDIYRSGMAHTHTQQGMSAVAQVMNFIKFCVLGSEKHRQQSILLAASYFCF